MQTDRRPAGGRFPPLRPKAPSHHCPRGHPHYHTIFHKHTPSAKQPGNAAQSPVPRLAVFRPTHTTTGAPHAFLSLHTADALPRRSRRGRSSPPPPGDASHTDGDFPPPVDAPPNRSFTPRPLHRRPCISDSHLSRLDVSPSCLPQRPGTDFTAHASTPHSPPHWWPPSPQRQ